MTTPKYGLTVGTTITVDGEPAFYLGVVGDRQNGPRAIPFADHDAMAKRVVELLNADPDPLCELLRQFCVDHRLPDMSACDLLVNAALTQYQRSWLESFCDFWDARQDLEGE